MFPMKNLARKGLKQAWKFHIYNITVTSPRGQWVNFLCSRRYIDNTTFFQELYKATLVGEHRFVPGGSALAMARRFAMEGCETLLGATLTKKLENIVKENLDNFKGEGWFVAADKYEEVEQFQLISPW